MILASKLFLLVSLFLVCIIYKFSSQCGTLHSESFASLVLHQLGREFKTSATTPLQNTLSTIQRLNTKEGAKGFPLHELKPRSLRWFAPLYRYTILLLSLKINLSTINVLLITPFLMNPSVRSHNHSPKNQDYDRDI